MKEGGGPLKTATAVVGLLAGIVTGMYVLGGLVIALRLLFDHFSLAGAVTAVGQLPRETVIATALLGVLALAALVGLAMAMVYGLAGRPRAQGEFEKLTLESWMAGGHSKRRGWRFGRLALWYLSWPVQFLRPPGKPVEHRRAPGEAELAFRRGLEAERMRRDRLTAGSRRRVLGIFLFFLLVAFGSSFVAWQEAKAADDGEPPILPFVFAGLLTYGAIAAGWFAIRRAARRPHWMRAEKALAAGAVWAGVAVIPVVMLAAAKPFETAQFCLEGEVAPVKGKLIGDGAEELFLEEEFGSEASLVALPADKVTKREIGDLSSTFACPLPPGQERAAARAEKGIVLGEKEGELARRLRPLLRFDSEEPWRPLAVGALLAEKRGDDPVHRACRAEEGAAERRLWAICELPSPGALAPGRGSPDFIDLEGRLADPESYGSPRAGCQARQALDCEGGRQSAIFYRRSSYGGLWYWDYWWFFRFNDYTGSFNECRLYCADHEGDWEGVTVITTRDVKVPEIAGAIYAAHRERVYVPGDLVPQRGGHPLVFVARGTHASYPFPCTADRCDQYSDLIGFRLPEEGHDGGSAWSGNVDRACALSDCVRPLPGLRPPAAGTEGVPTEATPIAGGWAAWPGRWGSSCFLACARAESSPSSPGLQLRFRCPWAPTRPARLAPDGTISRSDPAGDAERLRARCLAQRSGA